MVSRKRIEIERLCRVNDQIDEGRQNLYLCSLLDNGISALHNYDRTHHRQLYTLQKRHVVPHRYHKISPPKTKQNLQHLHHDSTLVHQAMIRAFHHTHRTPPLTHSLLHPPHCVLCNLLVAVAIPHLHLVRISFIRKSPGVMVVI